MFITYYFAIINMNKNTNSYIYYNLFNDEKSFIITDDNFCTNKLVFTDKEHIHKYLNMGATYILILECESEAVLLRDGIYEITCQSNKLFRRSLTDLQTYTDLQLDPYINTEISMDSASKQGNIHLLNQWISSDFDAKFSEDVLDVASENGNVEIVKWWHSNRNHPKISLKYTLRSLHGATMNDKLDVLNIWNNSGLISGDIYFKILMNLESGIYKDKISEKWWYNCPVIKNIIEFKNKLNDLTHVDLGKTSTFINNSEKCNEINNENLFLNRKKSTPHLKNKIKQPKRKNNCHNNNENYNCQNQCRDNNENHSRQNLPYVAIKTIPLDNSMTLVQPIQYIQTLVAVQVMTSHQTMSTALVPMVCSVNYNG